MGIHAKPTEKRMKYFIITLFCLLTFGELSYAQVRGGNRNRIDKKNTVADDPQVAFRMAFKAYKEKDIPKAQKLLKNTLDKHPTHVLSLILISKILVEQDDLKSAKKFIKTIPESEHHRPAIARILAEIAYRNGKPLKALQIINRTQSDAASSDDAEFFDNPNQDIASFKKQLLASTRQSQRKEMPYAKEKPATETHLTIPGDLPTVATERRLRLAIFSLSVAPSLDDTTLGSSTASYLTTAAVQTQCFRVVERENLEKVMIEQDFQMTDAVDTETAVETGYIMGVDAILVGSVRPMAQGYEVDGRLIRVETGEIIAATNQSISSVSLVRQSAANLMFDLTRAAYK